MTPIDRPDDDELLVLCGETASGKTALAVELAQAWDGEIVGADSVQIYRGFDIGSGKPTTVELAGVRHHLIDIVEPGERFDAGAFVARADEAIAEVRARGSVPIVCGGTYLWIKALVHGLADAPPSSPSLRAELQEEVRTNGSPSLHARLATLDPVSAARLHPNDATRIVRALEVVVATGKTLSEFQAEHGFRTARHRARLVAICHSRVEIEARIASRVHAMLEAGWVTEVATLIAAGHRDARAMSAVGYAEVRQHLEGVLAIEELEPAIVRATRIFARRQRTWLAKADVAWIDAGAIARE